MSFPCITYSLGGANVLRANDTIHRFIKKYTVTIITGDVDEGEEWRPSAREDGLIESFLKQSLTPVENEEFIRHVKGCSDCYGELEVYHMVNTVVTQLDSGSEEEDIDYKETLARMLSRADTQKRRRRFARYVFITVVVTLLIIIYFLIRGIVF